MRRGSSHEPTDRGKRRRVAAASLSLAVAAATSACSPATEAVPLDPDQDKPFVLTGVSDGTRIARLTGPDVINDTAAVGVAGTDLGYMVNLGDRSYFIFGDTFGDRDPDSYGGQ